VTPARLETKTCLIDHPRQELATGDAASVHIRIDFGCQRAVCRQPGNVMILETNVARRRRTSKARPPWKLWLIPAILLAAIVGFAQMAAGSARQMPDLPHRAEQDRHGMPRVSIALDEGAGELAQEYRSIRAVECDDPEPVLAIAEIWPAQW
jgi:hypothetical protein